MKFKTVFLIVNHNGERILEECLRSVFGQTERDFAVVMVDNGSRDRSLQIASQFSVHHVISLKKNTGFSRANNLGISYILNHLETEYIAFVNTDVVLKENWLKAHLEVLSREEYHFAQGIILRVGEPSVIDSLGIGMTPDFQFFDVGNGTAFDAAQFSSAFLQELFGVCFAACVFKAPAIQTLVSRRGTFFDERFHSFYEDVDLALDCRKLNMRGCLVPEAFCGHRRSFTADRHPFFKNYCLGRNYWLVLAKHFPFATIRPVLRSVIKQRLKVLLSNWYYPDRLIGMALGNCVGLIQAGRIKKGA